QKKVPPCYSIIECANSSGDPGTCYSSQNPSLPDSSWSAFSEGDSGCRYHNFGNGNYFCFISGGNNNNNNNGTNPPPSGGNSPTPPACTPGANTKIALSVKLDGIGISDFENKDPHRPNRTGNVRVFDTANSSSS